MSASISKVSKIIHSSESKSVITAFASAMEKIAPLTLADRSWDNVGLLLESPTAKLVDDKCRVLLTIDLTEPVYDEAVEKGASIILSYHPPWFRGEKRMTLDHSQGMMRMVALCASSGISIYSPHSALDAIQGGINDHVVDILTAKNFAESLPIVKSNPPNENCGVGRVVKLINPVTVKEVAGKWCKYAGIPNLRIAMPKGISLDSPISSMAICVGSGASVLNGVKADLYFTGEMSHHEILKANISHKSTVILTEHTNCERGYLKDILSPLLQERLEPFDIPFEILVSQTDRDPIEIISF